MHSWEFAFKNFVGDQFFKCTSCKAVLKKVLAVKIHMRNLQEKQEIVFIYNGRTIKEEPSCLQKKAKQVELFSNK